MRTSRTFRPDLEGHPDRPIAREFANAIGKVNLEGGRGGAMLGQPPDLIVGAVAARMQRMLAILIALELVHHAADPHPPAADAVGDGADDAAMIAHLFGVMRKVI